MMMVCYVVGGVLIAILMLHLFLELHYFLRMCLCVIIARLFKKRVKILDDTYVHGAHETQAWPGLVTLECAFNQGHDEPDNEEILAERGRENEEVVLSQTIGVCITTDVDTLLYHMNNARYLRELDFARVDFYERTGLYRKIRQKGGAVVQGACTIRYRRFVRPFSIFKITSKIIYWDSKAVYMEHRFITPKDDFVRAIAICQQRVIKCSAEDIMQEMLGGPEAGCQKPEIPLEVAKWIECNEISSANLRNGC